MNLNKLLLPYIYTLLLATLDIFTKYLIRKNNIQEYVVIEDILTIDLTYNTGIAFGLLSDYTMFTYILSIFVFIWLVFQIRDIKEQNIENSSKTMNNLFYIVFTSILNIEESNINETSLKNYISFYTSNFPLTIHALRCGLVLHSLT